MTVDIYEDDNGELRFDFYGEDAEIMRERAEKLGLTPEELLNQTIEQFLIHESEPTPGTRPEDAIPYYIHTENIHDKETIIQMTTEAIRYYSIQDVHRAWDWMVECGDIYQPEEGRWELV